MTERTAAVIQARMGSTRLPGKVLEDIAGVPMLTRVVRRVQNSSHVDKVVVATSTLDIDDPIDVLARSLGADVTRGDPLDLLSRYVKASAEADASTIVRITSDCPFIDPGLIDSVIECLRTTGADYAANNLEPRTFPRGLDVEVMRRSVLIEADGLDRDPGTREHVTPFIRDSGRYRLGRIEHEIDLSTIRWTVDTNADIELARVMASHFGGSIDTPWPTLLDAWHAHPRWHRINAHVQQKPVIRQIQAEPASEDPLMSDE